MTPLPAEPVANGPCVAPPTTPAPARGEAPAAIGHFQVRARLGAGAFGTVYRAYDP
jgi:hypothetical protein